MPTTTKRFGYGYHGGTVNFQVDIVPEPYVDAALLARVESELNFPPMWEAKEIAARDIASRFTDQEDPDHIRWEPLNDEYREWKEAQGHSTDILIMTGELESLASQSDAFIVERNELFYNFGAIPVYGRWHQIGLPNRQTPLPRRAFVGLSPEAEAEIVALFEEWSDDVLSESTYRAQQAINPTWYTKSGRSYGITEAFNPYTSHIFAKGEFGRFTGMVM